MGEIEDEFDERLPKPHVEATRVELDGATSILDLTSIYGIELPANAGFETIAGYMLFQLGHIPAVGEWVEFEGRRFTVAAMERNRIALVRIEKIGTEIVESEEAASDGVDVKGAPQIARH